MSIFKIECKDGLFVQPSNYIHFTKNGKSWAKLHHLEAHLKITIYQHN